MKDCLSCFYADFSGNETPCSMCSKYDKWAPIDMYIEPPQYNPEDVAFNKVGVKYDNDKPQWSLVPFKAMTQVVDVLTYGARKYAPDNWKKVPDARRRYIDAAFRHLSAYVSGEKNDSETGKSHLAHAMCCLLFLLAFDLGEHHD